MRSELVYRANDKVRNRFQLCSLASSSARRMNRSSVSMHLTINRALTAIGTQSPLWTIQVPLAETEIAPLEQPSIAGELSITVPVLDPTL